MNPVNEIANVMDTVRSFLGPRDAMNFNQVNKAMEASREKHIRTQYAQAFGEMKVPQNFDKIITATLLPCADNQPNAAVNHNTYVAPIGRIERWKWLAGLENDLDKEVQENYNRKIRMLENTQATSIIQLKNQLMAFWHSDREIKDYEQFKSDSRGGRISRVFFKCMGVLFRLFYNTSTVTTGKMLVDRSEETFAKMGGFTLNGKDYDVAAFHAIYDEEIESKFATIHDDTHRKFRSLTDGGTHIGIFETNQTHLADAFGYRGTNHNFEVQITRAIVDPSRALMDGYPTESAYFFRKDEPVTNSERFLKVQNQLSYRDTTEDPQGSDRPLDQKLTQIMIEMLQQNKNIISLNVNSKYDEQVVLSAAGFESRNTETMLRVLNEFRSKEGNKLFPPYEDYTSHDTRFNTINIDNANVFFSWDGPESWADIIDRQPILKPNAGILPEYWARRLNIVDDINPNG